MKNLYDLLEVSPRARPEVIKASYHALVKTFHPDKGGSDRVTSDINEAYATLSDVSLRKKYDADRSPSVGKLIGDYRVLELIAEGGFGTTYKGEHAMTGSPVCIKHALNISPQDEQILIEEAKAVWDLRHYAIPAMRNVVRLDDGSLALIMSYIQGPTLEKIILEKKALDPEHVCWITERILGALRYLHYNGVIHGDIKPANIIIQPESHQVVIVDYGLSLIRPTMNSTSKGYTPVFSSPEQMQDLPLLPESDFYALGMTMIHMLGGDASRKHVPNKTPDAVCEFVKRLIVKNPLDRPSWNKEDIIDTLQKVRLKAFGRSSSAMKVL